MFKEFALLGIVFLLVFLVFRWIYRKNRRLLQKILIGIFAVTVIVNVTYNLKYIIPVYNYEGVPIGDCRENLFSYKDDSEFKWQILFPMLRDRTVYVDNSDDLYQDFFALYASGTAGISIENDTKKRIFEEAEFSDNKIPLSMVELLNYAFEPHDSSLYEDRYPFLRIAGNQLEGCKELVAITDEKSNLYLMSRDYYDMYSEVGQ